MNGEPPFTFVVPRIMQRVASTRQVAFTFQHSGVGDVGNLWRRSGDQVVVRVVEREGAEGWVV